MELDRAGGRGKKNQSDANQLKRLKKRNSKYKRTIKALRRNQEGDDEDADEDIDAGDQFGGKNSKKKKKRGE